MTPTDKYFDFMKGIAQQIGEFQKIEQSDGEGIDKILRDSFGEDVYPAALFIRPRYRMFRNEAKMDYAYFDGRMYVVTKTKIEDYGTDNEDARIENDLNRAEELSLKIGKKLSKYNRDVEIIAPIEFTWNDWTCEPVQMMSTDNCYGYLVDFKIGIPIYDAI
jgi:hypothetical protein